MELQRLPGRFAVCKLAGDADADFRDGFLFFAKTDQEVSLVCEEERVPAQVLAVEKGWRALRLAGRLDFGLVGVLAEISRVLAEAGISIFAVSTYDTDYVLLKEQRWDDGVKALEAAGHHIL